MHSLSITLKISLIIFAVSHIAIAGPVPDLLASAPSTTEGQASGGSVSRPNQAAGSNSLSGLDVLELLSENGGKGGEADSGKPPSYNKGVGGSSLAGTRFRQGNPVKRPKKDFGESAKGESAKGGSVRGGTGLLNILAGNGGDGGRASGGLGMLGMLRKRYL